MQPAHSAKCVLPSVHALRAGVCAGCKQLVVCCAHHHMTPFMLLLLLLLQGWAAPTDAQACKSCGLPQPTAAVPGWLSDRTVDQLRLDPDTGSMLQQAVRGSPDSCCEC